MFPPSDTTEWGKPTLLRAVRTLRFVHAIQATCCIPGHSKLARFAKMLESAERRYADGGIWGEQVAHDVYVVA